MSAELIRHDGKKYKKNYPLSRELQASLGSMFGDPWPKLTTPPMSAVSCGVRLRPG